MSDVCITLKPKLSVEATKEAIIAAAVCGPAMKQLSAGKKSCTFLSVDKTSAAAQTSALNSLICLNQTMRVTDTVDGCRKLLSAEKTAVLVCEEAVNVVGCQTALVAQAAPASTKAVVSNNEFFTVSNKAQAGGCRSCR